LTDRNIWPVVIPVTTSTGTAYYLLTFDREQVTGAYSYGNLHWYRASEVATPIDTRPAGIKTVKVYPNPVGKFLHVEGLTAPACATVRNLNGQIVLMRKETLGLIDVRSLPPNVYLIDFGGSETIKFIKSNHTL
jgi:hypothetical protein